MSSGRTPFPDGPSLPRAYEAGSPASDKTGYRRCLAQYPTGVAIITAAHKEQLSGVTVNSFASLSMDPPLVLWALQKTSQSLPVFEAAEFFAVNFLATDQVELSQKFARSSPDKFNDVPFTPGLGDAPIVDGAAAVLECVVRTREDAGDHILFIGRVEKFVRFEAEPLVFGRGGYARLYEHASTHPRQPREAVRIHQPCGTTVASGG